MGSSKSTLKRSMVRGDELQVLQIYRAHAEIRRHIDPNEAINEDGDTFVHFASRFAMKTFLR